VKPGAPAVIWLFAAIFAGIEALLTASDFGLAPRGLRQGFYLLFAFYDFWFESWRAGEGAPVTLWWSFLTHAFLHGGFAHMAMNTVVFVALGAHLCRAVGELATLLLFAGCAVGGALAFGLIADTGAQFVPMVGASGALFGFLGAMKRWEWRYVTAYDLPKRRFWRTIIALAGVNVLLTVGFASAGGGVAWEAHLGGFVAGWLAAGALTPRRGMAIGPI
jgi:membrane associated rhomboid family serine protease